MKREQWNNARVLIEYKLVQSMKKKTFQVEIEK